MEAKLKEYRARRRRQEFIEKATENFQNTGRRFVDLFRKMIKIDVDEAEPGMELAPAFKVPAKNPFLKKSHLEESDSEEDNRNQRKITEDQSSIESDSDAIEDEVVVEEPPRPWYHIVLKWTLYLIVWLILYSYFIALQFGAVFFAISLLIFIYVNTGTRPRKKGEVSAYSVFNENCESIEGTVTAEKLQKEMYFGNFRLF